MNEIIDSVPVISAQTPAEPEMAPVDHPTPEQLNRQHLEKVFAPFPSVEAANELPDDYYAHLLNDTEPMTGTVEEAAVRGGKEFKVTLETQADAEAIVSQVVGRSGLLGEFLGDYMRASGLTNYDGLVKAVHDDLDLRIGLGDLFLDMLDIRADHMPDGIKRNRQKSPDVPGYRDREPLTSREYVALLVIAKLDGTYDKAREQGPIEYDGKGEAIRGQHRWAADELLFH